ncbi:MAG TPA: hypothetical protein VK911_08830 [Vicinamibacterales bacterium]|nr:hypothetical protein [Vicinamibacterales bacterium]
MSTVAFVPASRWLRRWWPILLLAGAAALVVAFVGLSWWVQAGALERAALAMREHPGDEVEALIAYVESDTHSLLERNRAVWALGQLRDRRALPVLEKHYTGEPCDHGRFLCQHELQKAIKLSRGEGFGGWITNALKLR